MSDQEDDVDAFFKHAKNDVFPNFKRSAVSVILVSDDPDPKLCLEVGAAILFDKPIIAFVPPGRKVPANLRRAASVIIEGDISDPGMQEKVHDAISQILKKDVRARIKIL